MDRVSTNMGLNSILVKESTRPVLYVPIHANAQATATWTDMPAAETMFQASTGRIQKIDMSNFVQARLIGRVTTAGASGSKLIVRYNTAGSVSSTIAGNWTSDVGVTEVAISLTSTGMPDSGWITLAPGAKGDYHLTIVGSGGDATADPVLGSLQILFR